MHNNKSRKAAADSHQCNTVHYNRTETCFTLAHAAATLRMKENRQRKLEPPRKWPFPTKYCCSVHAAITWNAITSQQESGCRLILHAKRQQAGQGHAHESGQCLEADHDWMCNRAACDAVMPTPAALYTLDSQSLAPNSATTGRSLSTKIYICGSRLRRGAADMQAGCCRSN